MRSLQRVSVVTALAVGAAMFSVSCDVSHSPAMAQAAGKIMTTASGLKIEDSQVGTGATRPKGRPA